VGRISWACVTDAMLIAMAIDIAQARSRFMTDMGKGATL
jgi:hypothetical protein